MSNFDIAIGRLLTNEGGYTVDNGGPTKYGISQRSYPKLDIAALTVEQAKALYKRDFWNVIGGDSLPAGIGFQVLDFAVNSGPSTALRALQRSIGVADDGNIGPITLAALKAIEPHDLIMRFIAERQIFMTNCSAWPAAGRGWMRRLASNLKIGAGDV